MTWYTILLLWLHFIGMALAVGGGVGLSRVGPRLIAAAPKDCDLLWSLEKFFSAVGGGGLLILLITGPLMVWLVFGGFEGFTVWFDVKMAFVAVATLGVGLHEWAGRRFFRGDVSAVPLMFIGGRVAGLGIIAAMLCAVLNFQ